MPLITRRDFLKGLGAGAAGMALLPPLRMALAQSSGEDNLVCVFLRGGMDGLSLVPPIAGNDRELYEMARPSLKIPVSGNGAAIALGNSGGLWGLHPRASLLAELYQAGHLGVVLAAGMPAPVTRSHFDAQANMELGLAGQGSGVGWLTRYLLSAGLPESVPIPAVSAGSITATSLLASTESITMGDGGDFRLDTAPWPWNSADNYDDPISGLRGWWDVLPELWQGGSALEAAGRQALDALALIRPIDFDGYTPSGGAAYDDGQGGRPYSPFAAQLKMLAQLIKLGVGMRVATVDLGSFDTHNGQGVPTSSYDYFGNKVEELSRGLHAFYTDLAADGFGQRSNVLVMSEFGRRLNENDDAGTDHGYGNVMLALGGAVNGGQTYGNFAGLDSEHLFEQADVAVTTDYRHVLGEAVMRRLGNRNLGYIFPGYSDYQPLDLFQGEDQPVGDFDSIFASGFD